jgi:hypothetical protein
MENITSIGFELPNDQTETENYDWFNMCSKRNFLYYEVDAGQKIFFSKSQNK